MNAAEAIEKLTTVLRRSHYSYSTEKTYCGWIRRYIGFLAVDRQGGKSEDKFERFLTHLAREGVAAATQNQAFNAVVFFYKHALKTPLGDVKALRARRGHRVRSAPNRSQVRDILNTIEDVHGYPTRLMAHLLYGCGLRVNEPLNLRIKDIDFENSRLTIREAKRNKDRIVNLPCSLAQSILEQMNLARKFWELDHERQIPVPLPGRLNRKYKTAPFSWQWYWLFPSAKPCRHPRTGETVRWRCHEANVQKAVREAARRCGIEGAITPHNLRHAYATHLLDGGVKMTAVAQAMGHESIETTAGYDHSTSLSVPSPLALPEAPVRTIAPIFPLRPILGHGEARREAIVAHTPHRHLQLAAPTTHNPR